MRVRPFTSRGYVATILIGFGIWAVVTAIAVGMLLLPLTTPMLIVFLAFQKYFMEGVAMTGLKGYSKM